ncbi:protein associated with RNAse G/E [Arthrobacter pigmenti]|uniref:Protein associated with RNAse G/E n=1 Tax=Arthrobacter pigmenti TaxID=271432 RepID=A0A846RWD8_9MICC|nr:DUF402 domain-containing protein [Arthrobacter pigmenti]NJC23905.1 protein associated with RNAse G/E [Arthrobacter pigmenti]
MHLDRLSQLLNEASAPRWAHGDTVTWSYRNPGFPDLIDCRPVTVVDDGDKGLVLWLAPGTQMLHQVLANGSDTRSAEGSDRFTLPRAQAVRTWGGGGILIIFQPDTMYSVWCFESQPGVRDIYYVNIEEPFVRTPEGIVSTDLVLDVVVSPDRQWKFKDEDELAFAQEAGVFDDAAHARIRRAGDDAVAAVERWDYPFNAGFEHFEPDPSWPIPELPSDATWQYET